MWDSVDNFRWVQATLTLMQVFVESGGERMVMAGTCAEYDWRYGYCSESVTPLFPQSVYGTCKNALCTMVDALTKKTGVHAAWGRIFYLYGPHEHPERLVPFVIRSVMQRVRVPCSHGNQIRDYLHVEDVADAFVSLLKSNVTGVINIGSGCPTSLKSIIYRIAKDLDGENLIELGAKPTPVGDPPFLVADVARLTHELGWHPKYDLARGLEQTVNWWRHQLNKS
ncbi:MAG: hypothetical protein NPIRA05_10600 [Nitrospirales bacterium]|nr:MAG: hypothetical protein NPIRA05_10600 [Nitrospirales bacterium]